MALQLNSHYSIPLSRLWFTIPIVILNCIATCAKVLYYIVPIFAPLPLCKIPALGLYFRHFKSASWSVPQGLNFTSPWHNAVLCVCPQPSGLGRSMTRSVLDDVRYWSSHRAQQGRDFRAERRWRKLMLMLMPMLMLLSQLCHRRRSLCVKYLMRKFCTFLNCFQNVTSSVGRTRDH